MISVTDLRQSRVDFEHAQALERASAAKRLAQSEAIRVRDEVRRHLTDQEWQTLLEQMQKVAAAGGTGAILRSLSCLQSPGFATPIGIGISHRRTTPLAHGTFKAAASNGRCKTMSGSEGPEESQALRVVIEALRKRIASVEARAEGAEREAHQAREEVLRLRDQVAAAQHDQQDLKTTRARLTRVQVRGLIARVLNRH